MQLRHISVALLITEAGGDPWAVNAGLQTGQPAQIDALAQAFYRAGRCTQEAGAAFDDARRHFAASWSGGPGEETIKNTAEVERVTKELGLQSLQIPRIAIDLESVAVTLAEVQRAGAQSIATLEGQLQQIDDELGAALAAENDAGMTDPDHSALSALISALEREAIADATSTFIRLQALRGGYSKQLAVALTTLRTDGYDGAAIKRFDASAETQEALQIPPPETSAEGANRWWQSLTPEQQDQMVAEHNPALGNLNGIPVEARSRVNAAVLNDDLHRVEDKATNYGVTAGDVTKNPGRYGLTAQAITRYTNARRTREGLTNSATAVDARGNHPDVFLLKYDPEAFRGEGAAAVAIGNPDNAANTAVLVPGLGSNMRDGTLADRGAVRVYGEAACADPKTPTAAIMWMGYNAPNAWCDPGLWAPNMARTGGQALAADVNALTVTHAGAPAHVTVIGNSYGSTTVSDAAAAYGMRSDDVVLVGSPGTDLAHSAGDFHLPEGGNLYVGAASADPVTWAPARVTGPGLVGFTLGGLGADPSVDGYGSTRFRAEVAGASINPTYDHLHYFDDGSESLFSIADVVSGHGEALQRDGMTARHRGEYFLNDWIDPEAMRSPTTGHRHAGPS